MDVNDNKDKDYVEGCLIIVDVQKEFISEETKYVERKIASLISRRHFEYIVATKFINTEHSPFVRLLNWKGLMDEKSQELCNSITDKADKVITKETYTCLTEEMKEFIKVHEINKIYFVGMDIDASILKSALDCFESGINIEILAHYCSSSSGQSNHESAIRILETTIGKDKINYRIY